MKVKISEEEFIGLYKHLKNTRKTARPAAKDALYILLEGDDKGNFVNATYVNKDNQDIIWVKEYRKLC